MARPPLLRSLPLRACTQRARSLRGLNGALGTALALALASAATVAATVAPPSVAPAAAAAPLEAVKRNPQLARSLCQEFRELNRQGISAYSPAATAQVAQRQGLSRTDAEVLTTYVVGLHCPDVR